MMRRFIIIGGALLSAALPLPAMAGALADAAHSDAVKQVLQRAEDAKAFSDVGDAAATALSWVVPGLSRSIIEATSRPLPVANYELQPGSLARTSCLQGDVLLFSILMNKVRISANEGVDNGDVVRVTRLSDLYAWLAERQQKLILNAADPKAKDIGYWKQQNFESSSSSSSTSSTPSLCYFDTDYLAPNLAGYGCDSTVMDAVFGAMPGDQQEFKDALLKEKEAMAKIEDALRTHSETADSFSDLQMLLDDSGASGASPSAGALASHKRVQGCKETIDPRITLHALRGPFAVLEDDRRLVKEHQMALLLADQDRDLPEDLAEIQSGSVVMQILTSDDEAMIRNFTRLQTTNQTALLVAGGDAYHMMQTALGGLTSSIGRLSRLGSTLDGGLRGFVRDFAYFLLRSCTTRPCREMLERVTRAALKDDCFPYVSGEYLSDSCDAPRWQKCRDAMPWPQATGDTTCTLD